MKLIINIKYVKDIKRAFVFGLLNLVCISIFAQSMSDYESYPPYVAEKKDPLIMLAMSLDHQLFYKAYTDYDDLYGNDGIAENTYHPEVDYIGYFDHEKCYTYRTGDSNPSEYFQATGMATASGGVTNKQYCNNAWSGNFLNWVSMTRVDLVRKVLYGGKRVRDSRTKVILERAYLPNDAHSFAKFYDGDDLNKLVPSSVSTQVKTSYAACGSEPAESASDSDWDDYIDCRRERGITFCNTTLDKTANVTSAHANEAPLIRAIAGNYTLWASNERFQCLYGWYNSGTDSEVDHMTQSVTGVNNNNPRITKLYAYDRNPEEPDDGIGDFAARVRACRPNVDFGSEDCKEYTDSSNRVHTKPVGLLQTFGDADEKNLEFGLITGSYQYNKSYGKLRKNIGPITDEVNQNTGAFITSQKGIISTLDSARIANYIYEWTTTLPAGENSNSQQGTYNHPSYDNCKWGRTSFNDGDCTGWGNPFSEIMFEGYRYLAGASASYVSQPNLDTALGGELVNMADNVSWQTNFSDLSCKSLNMVGFNASSVSYDNDIRNVNLSSAGIGTESITVAAATNRLSASELDASIKYFVGEVAGVTTPANSPERQQCTAKSLTNLADAIGTCPDSPRLGGTYLAAGLAHHARTHGVRGNGTDPSMPITTFGVNVSPALPKLSIPIPGRSDVVVMQPACRSLRNGNFTGNCAIVDFKLIKPHVETGGVGTGSVFVVWEDSEQGGDYDMDIAGLIEYTITSSTIEFRSTVTEDTTSSALGFGYIVSGLGNHDGFYTPASTLDNGTPEYTVPTGYERYGCPYRASATSGLRCKWEGDWAVHSLNIASAGAAADVAFLQPPLYYAAKWGGNQDRNGDPKIVDGKPETYYDVQNPSQLQKQMRDLFNSISDKENAASASGVAVNDTPYNRMVVQTVYYPLFTEGDEELNWIGNMHSMFVTQENDSFGNARAYLVEDSNQNGLLDASDKRINRVFYDDGENATLAEYKDGSVVELSEVTALWNAADRLSAISNVTTQRTWGANANSGRYIISAIDTNGDGLITQTEQVPFSADLFSGLGTITSGLGANNYHFLDVDSGLPTDAQKVINYIRGDESETSFRSRTVNINGADKTFLLGDIVHSTPLIVGSPKGNFYDSHGDTDYLDFYLKYYNRRNVAFVGSNDGMLHAFNAGFPSQTQQGFELTHDNDSAAPGDDPFAHALGEELWGYVPFNLLPHLKWLTDPDYTHVAYVDATPQVFDVKIFDESADAAHVGDWGTILVVGMRLGGGEYDIDPDGAGPKTDQTLRSAYVILDITDPERAPRVLGEITHPDMGFTTAEVDVVYRNGTWKLIMGSGPTGNDGLSKAVSDSNAKLFALNLNQLASGTISMQVHDTNMPEAFVGGIRAADWDRDSNTDAIYFGLVGGRNSTGTARRGDLMRARVTDSGLTGIGRVLSGMDEAFAETPTTVSDGLGNMWVYAGAGRFYVDSDDSNNNRLQAYYAVKENADILTASPITIPSIPKSDLMDVSDLRTSFIGSLFVNGVKSSVPVRTIGGAALVDGGGSAVSASTHEELANYMTQISNGNGAESPIRGWVRDYTTRGELTATRTAVDPQLYSLVFSTYTPTNSTSSCPPPGAARSYSLDLRTGIFNGYYTNISLDPNSPTDQDKPLTEADTTKIDDKLNDPVIISELDVKVNDNVDAELNFEGKRSTAVESGRRTWHEIPLDRFYTW